MDPYLMAPLLMGPTPVAGYSAGASVLTKMPKPVIHIFNPVAYSGRWYEVARYPFQWEHNCDTAIIDYSPIIVPAGSKLPVLGELTFRNTCLKEGKPIYSRTGVISQPNPLEPGKLLVSFTDNPLEGKGNYWIHWTDYVNFAFVGGAGDSFFWVLCRRSQLTRAEIAWVLESTRRLGYDPCKLISNRSTRKQ